MKGRPPTEVAPSWTVAACALAAVFLVLACHEQPKTTEAASAPDVKSPDSWAVEPMSGGYVSVTRDSSTCRDCLHPEPYLLLGDQLDGGGYLSQPALLFDGLVRDRKGNYWVSQTSEVKVFDDRGRYVGRFGQPGQGPMDFQHAVPLYEDSSGFVHIMDAVNFRETIVGSNFELVETKALSVFPRSAAPLADGKRWAVHAVIQESDRIGYPLHIIEGAQVLKSFGIPETGEAVFNRNNIRRTVATDSSDRIYSAEYDEYRIEAWTADGDRLLGLEGPALNEQPRDYRRPTWYDNPPPSFILDLTVDEQALLWVLIWEREDDWVDAREERVAANGRVYLMPSKDPIQERSFDTRIDVIDLNRRQIIASMVDDRLMWKFLPDRTAAGPDYDPTEDVRLAIWKLELTMRTKSGERGQNRE